MMLFDQSYTDAISKREHLIALGQTTVYLSSNAADLPWSRVEDVEAGSSFRLNGPNGVYLIVRHGALVLKWNVEFEGRDANGRGVSLFDRDKLRGVMAKLPPKARQKFADFLLSEVLPPLQKRTAEIREALNLQADSEDCVRGLIAFATEPRPAPATER